MSPPYSILSGFVELYPLPYGHLQPKNLNVSEHDTEPKNQPKKAMI